jgi:hypothetical protein
MGVFDGLFGRGGSGPDGSCHSKAITVGSIGEEYAWMQQNCPGFQPGMQSVQEIDGKPFDVVTWQNGRGEERTVYFDISAFYGKPKSAAGPPCPYCGAPLRTDKAKQCFECGTNWRDPANVIRRAGKA